jgi:hypothetical protein
VLRIPAALACATAILLISNTSEARPRLRFFSLTPKPAAVVSPKPTTVAPQRSTGGVYVSVGGRAGAATSQGSTRFVSDDQAKGPLQFDPTLASADSPPPAALANNATPAPLKELGAAPASESGVAKESAPTEKVMLVAKEPAKAEPVRPHLPSLAPVAGKPKQAASLQPAVICYVHRDGSCRPD